MSAIIAVDRRTLPRLERARLWRQNGHPQRIAGSRVARMFGAAIPTRAGTEDGQKIDLGKERQRVARSDGAGFHKVLARVAGKTGAHKDVEHIMHHPLHLCRGLSGVVS